MINQKLCLALSITASICLIWNRASDAQPPFGMVAKPIIKEVEAAILIPAKAVLPANLHASLVQSANAATISFINLAGIAFDAERSHRVAPADLMTAELNPDGLSQAFFSHFGNPTWENTMLPTYGRESTNLTKAIRTSLEEGRIASKYSHHPIQTGTDYFNLATIDNLKILFRAGVESAERGFDLASLESGQDAFSRCLRNIFIVLRLIDTTLAESSYATEGIDLITSTESQALLSDISRLGILISDTWMGIGQEEYYAVLAIDSARTYISILQRLQMISREGQSPLFPDLTIRSYHDILTMQSIGEHFPVIGNGIPDFGQMP